MDRHDVQDIRAHANSRPARTGRNDVLGDVLNGITRRNALHIALRIVGADPDVVVPVARGEPRPAGGKDPLRFVFDVVRLARLPLGPDLRENADVGRLLLNPRDEAVEVVRLP